MIPDEHRGFIESHSLCIVGYDRKSGPPSLSPAYYWLDGDEIVFSTTRKRGKGRAVTRSEDLSVCIIEPSPPFPYPLVRGRSSMDEAGAVDAMMRIGEIMTGNPLPESARSCWSSAPGTRAGSPCVLNPTTSSRLIRYPRAPRQLSREM